MFFYPDNSELLETWILNSIFKYFWTVRIGKQIRPSFFGVLGENLRYGSTILFRDIVNFSFLLKFLSHHYHTTLEDVWGVQRSGQAKGTIICLFGLLYFSQNWMTKRNLQILSANPNTDLINPHNFYLCDKNELWQFSSVFCSEFKTRNKSAKFSLNRPV